MFAIIEVGGKQYKVIQGQSLEVDRQEGKAGSTFAIERVLLVSDGKKTTIGKPVVKDVAVKAKILEHMKGDKLDIYRYKSKVRHRRHIGFRPELTKIEIVSIGHA